MCESQMALGITFYHPKKQEINYIVTLSKFFSHIYIYDNSDSNVTTSFIQRENINYFFNGKNEGLSTAFNCFLQKAYEDGMDYLLLLDQDSLFNVQELLNLKEKISEKPFEKNVGIYACKIYPPNVKKECVMPTNDDTTTEEEKVISSGSFINLKAIYENGIRYDENLFIDYVDTDFCKQVRNSNLKIICYNQFVLEQSLGYLYNGYICHSAVRHYYMIRDLGYMNKKYYSKSVTVLKTFKFYFSDLLLIMREDEKMKKIVYSSKGLIDYLKNVKGECTL